MTKHNRHNIIIGTLLLLTVLTGCRQDYERMTFQTSGDFTQSADTAVPTATSLEDEQQTNVQTVLSSQETWTVPAAYHLLPATRRETVFDQLLGQAQNVWFLQESGVETYAVFDEANQTISRLAQARLLGNQENSILLLLGVSFVDAQPSGVDVFTFEKGRSSDIQRYIVGKEDFLSQFSNGPMITDHRQIQGITGATPVWKPVAQQIQESFRLLLNKKTDSVWIAQMRQNGNIWHRSIQVPAETVLQASAQPEETAVLSDPSISPVTHPMTVLPDSSDTVYDFEPTGNLAANSGGDFLYKHWQIVATIEITLLVCGLLIIVTMQIVRMVYK